MRILEVMERILKKKGFQIVNGRFYRYHLIKYTMKEHKPLENIIKNHLRRHRKSDRKH